MRVSAVLLGLSLLLWGLPASEAKATYVDFTSESYTCAGCGSPDGASSAELVVDGVTWTFTPEPEPFASLFYDTGGPDGFGVRYSYEYDEIEGTEERLVISFSEEIYINEVHLTDIFYEDGYREMGWYSLDGGTGRWFIADWSQVPGATNGELVVGVNGLASSITFGAPGLVAGQDHEFSVAGLDATPVVDTTPGTTSTPPMPEPNAAVLFPIGCALVGWALWSQRKLAA